MNFSQLLPRSFFLFLESIPSGNWQEYFIRVFPIVEWLHMIGLSILIGSVLIVDLRLLGFGMRLTCLIF